MITILLAALTVLLFSSYVTGQSKARKLAEHSSEKWHSHPNYHGYMVALWCGLPAFFVWIVWIIGEPMFLKSFVFSNYSGNIQELSEEEIGMLYLEIQNVAMGALNKPSLAVQQAAESYHTFQQTSHWALFVVILCAAIGGIVYGRGKVQPLFRARNFVEKSFHIFLVVCSAIAVLTTVGIIFSLIFESFRFFTMVSITDFLFGTKWSPQMALRADQVASQGAFGAIPLFVGTMLIAFIAMCIAVPIGLMSAIYLTEYASRPVRSIAKPALEILAGIPTVVYGFFAALTVAPHLRSFGEAIGMDVSSESALAAGVVMGVMIIHFVSSLSDDVISAVPQSLRDGSYGLGATKSETIKKVVLPAALPGVVGAILLAVSRAVGETMIVVMAAGLAANLTLNPLANVTTVTVQIVTILVGDQEFDSPKTLSAFALGLVLFCITLALNIIALQVVKKYREKYD